MSLKKNNRCIGNNCGCGCGNGLWGILGNIGCISQRIKRNYKLCLLDVEVKRAKIKVRRKIRQYNNLKECSPEELKCKLKETLLNKFYSNF